LQQHLGKAKWHSQIVKHFETARAWAWLTMREIYLDSRVAKMVDLARRLCVVWLSWGSTHVHTTTSPTSEAKCCYFEELNISPVVWNVHGDSDRGWISAFHVAPATLHLMECSVQTIVAGQLFSPLDLVMHHKARSNSSEWAQHLHERRVYDYRRGE